MVPDDFFVVEHVFNSGHYDLTTHAGLAAFHDAAVIALNAHDENWGHLLKRPGQTQTHGHGEDSVLYKLPGNKAWAVDIIKGAGALPPYTQSNPKPSLRWGPDPVAYYKHSDWLDPAQHGENGDPGHPPATPVVKIPTYEELGGDAYWRNEIGVPLQADMAQRGQQLNDGSSVWFARPIFQILEAYAKGQTPNRETIIKKTRNEWRAILGLPLLP